MQGTTLEKNLSRTLELIDLCFRLKETYFRLQHPGASPEKIHKLIYQGILARKEKQWTSRDPISLTIDGETIPLARPESLIRMKELSNRPQDLLDIAALKEAQDDQ
jgi:hypothetical protein